MIDVSVCLITYNHKKYIAQALDSILMQQVHFQWEIIIADDCSTDGTTGIIKEYQSRFPDLIRILDRETNLGPGKNFCDLIGSAKGKYIAYLEGDDYWIDARKLQKQYEFLQSKPDFSMCYHQIHWIDIKTDDHSTEFISNQQDAPVSALEDLLEKGWFIRSCTMFFKKVQLPEDFEKLHVGDYPLHIILATTGNIGFIKEPMGVYRTIHGYSDSNLSSTSLEKQKQNYTGEIFLLNYLDKYTAKKYKKHFGRRKFNNSIQYIKNIYKTKKSKTAGAVLLAIRQNSFLFLLKYSFLRIFKFK